MNTPSLDWFRAASIAVAAVVVGSCSSSREPPVDPQAVYARAVPGFGGLFIDDDGVPTAYLTDLGQRDTAQQALAAELRERGFALEQLRFVRGTFDYLQLDGWFKQAGPAVFENPDVVFLDLDEARNQVVVGVVKAEQRARMENTLAKLGIPAAAIVVEYTEPVVFLSSLRERIRPIPAGVGINRVSVNATHFCSLGFNIDTTKSGNKTDHRRSFVTAGHCTEDTPDVQGSRFRQIVENVGLEIADPPGFAGGACPLFAPAKCRYSDAARALYTGGTPSSLAGIARTTHSGGLTGSRELLGTFRITAKRLHPLSGARVHKIGITTGWTVGRVTKTGVSVRPQGAKLIYVGQARVAAGVQGGDSGAPVFEINPGGKTVTLLGILFAGYSTEDEYFFSPMSGIEHDLGTLRVSTSAPSGTRQAPDLVPERLPGVAGRPGFCRRNAVGNLVVRVRNQSNRDLPASTIARVVFSPTEVVARSTPPLAAGAAADLTFQIPSACSADGSCNFTIGVDADLEVDERHGDEVDEHEINNIETGECFFACPSGKHCCKPAANGTCAQCLPVGVACP